jgi:hypothetical protein
VRRRATARKRIADSKTLHAGSWVLGYGHHLGDEDVEISSKNNKERKEAEVRKRKREKEKKKKFDDDVKRVLTESRPEEWTTQEDCRVGDLKVVVRWFHRPGDMKCIMKKGELWEGGKKQREEANMIVLALLLTRRLRPSGEHQLKPQDKNHQQSVNVNVFQARPPQHEPKSGNSRMIILPLLLVPDRKGQLKGKD